MAVAGRTTPTVNVRIRPGGLVTAAVTVQAPSGAQPGEHFLLNIFQRQQGRIVGGSTYVIAIAKPR